MSTPCSILHVHVIFQFLPLTRIIVGIMSFIVAVVKFVGTGSGFVVFVANFVVILFSIIESQILLDSLSKSVVKTGSYLASFPQIKVVRFFSFNISPMRVSFLFYQF